jgi:predicted PurR-regulated permease PerM
MSFKTFESLCTPAKIYFAIALISCIIALFGGIPILAVFLKLVFAFIWTYILAWLCKHGYKTISWFLVLLPYIVIVLGLFGIFILSKQHKAILNTVKLQGAFGDENFTNKHR